MTNKQKVFIKTFGCRTNLFDSQVMLSHLEDFEIIENENEADIIIVNSCTVTNGADSGVRGYVNSANKMGAKVYLTGCGAHTKGESLFNADKVFGVFGQSEKAKINEMLKKETKFYEIGDLDFIDDTVVEEFIGKSRAFIKIQEGCNFRCSYCIIPFVRGDARSHDEEKILEQIRRLAANGFGEFVLTGTNVGSYGQGEKRSMAGLLKRMSQIKGVRRIRIGSMEPIQITEEFKELLGEPWLEKHLHVAIQHSSQEMLRIMNRRNRVESDIKLLNELSQKGFALGTDFIVGHPGETDALWKEAMENLKQMPLTHVHAFTYSKRDGTPSATMKGEINGLVSKERMLELNALITANNLDFRQKHRVPLEVLIESEKGNIYAGLDQFFNRIEVECEHDLSGNWITIEEYEINEEANYARL
ncbi:MAG: tRNA (N(6)-L-threonylcarbamoyladenosine(37)-C(2))-methylthiotransferase MtaB [Campylobacterales bacterium]|nr:tRNA (N(6)-L-threonylcarbamoyladenosine(37)-C(2))-methylthiotransferase MtaB [Campylobacterales bacterium]